MHNPRYVEMSYQPSPISDGTPVLAPCLATPPRPLPCRPCTHGTQPASDAVARGGRLLIAGTRSRLVKTGLRSVFGRPITILATSLLASSVHRSSHAYIFIGPHLKAILVIHVSSQYHSTNGRPISHFIPFRSSHSSWFPNSGCRVFVVSLCVVA